VPPLCGGVADGVGDEGGVGLVHTTVTCVGVDVCSPFFVP
jgi:hypothetical protein